MPQSPIIEDRPWLSATFPSGTAVVQRKSGIGPWYHVSALADDTDGQDGRYDVVLELKAWLNGGDEPWWLELLHRTAPDCVRLPHGCEIQATGPMIDRATPPSWGDWAPDQSADARIARGLLIDALMNRNRPE